MSKIKIDKSEFVKLTKEVKREEAKAWQETGKFFKNKTPVRTGNARRRTSYNKTDINARYDYAKYLDEGSSRQAPRGMSDPSIRLFRKLIAKKFGRL